MLATMDVVSKSLYIKHKSWFALDLDTAPMAATTNAT